MRQVSGFQGFFNFFAVVFMRGEHFDDAANIKKNMILGYSSA